MTFILSKYAIGKASGFGGKNEPVFVKNYAEVCAALRVFAHKCMQGRVLSKNFEVAETC